MERFLGVTNAVGLRDQFYFDAEKGFHCLRGSGCLPRGKGRSHPEARDPEGFEAVARAFFAPYNRELYEMIGHDFGWRER